ncbi:hypothetical protein ASPZODRAFT_77442 [Penicilliopsis zonata CBS 506.65]|uniref:Terpene synthase n=1 Tax=Penicilliopsis zonata CBS 506.65 TaxID=1073090 RepID=A0A1L9S4Z3_9EURO|nr:hypothetical protein ASPZODRAFT_77442 [Penicilliopsis zonata CBS 506.65]OJJ42226.1 hypothetical protein ASPZODRAFT_77442 [Penicilliopsis zonata CBS 506.65]
MFSKPSLKPFNFFFDPAPHDVNCSNNLFSYLKNASQEIVPGLENSVCFNPREIGLPWSTAFPIAVHSKYWQDARIAAEDLLRRIRFGQNADQEELNERDHLLLDSAVSAPIHMFPGASSSQAKVLAKGNVFIFVHDGNGQQRTWSGKNVLYNIIIITSDHLTFEPLPEDSSAYHRQWKNQLFQEWVNECVEENINGGLQFVHGALHWAKHTLENPLRSGGEFTVWSDYVEYRNKDFLSIAVSGMLQLSTGVEVSDSEKLPLSEMYTLYMTHFSLTNDLYSYEKEVIEAEEYGTPVTNGVAVLEQILNVSGETAKSILRSILIGLEKKLDAIYNAHTKSGKLNLRQLRYARAMLEGLAGNIFYSATAGRYARVVPGSRILSWFPRFE